SSDMSSAYSSGVQILSTFLKSRLILPKSLSQGEKEYPQTGRFFTPPFYWHNLNQSFFVRLSGRHAPQSLYSSFPDNAPLYVSLHVSNKPSKNKTRITKQKLPNSIAYMEHRLFLQKTMYLSPNSDQSWALSPME
ncbi:hypothetical protein L9F63_005403, partial [Diploptera punctata]